MPETRANPSPVVGATVDSGGRLFSVVGGERLGRLDLGLVADPSLPEKLKRVGTFLP